MALSSQINAKFVISMGEMAFYAERDAAYYRVVRSWTELLTKRRAVDFCRVATALCRTA
ncbi:putative leader peptide [Actinoallomurus acaciae]|uniref:Leader peptide n=1 Tax=Actinoallomurus acaciae TaxID=502577 RepID=A0ABV5YKV7_9ACTN